MNEFFYQAVAYSAGATLLLLLLTFMTVVASLLGVVFLWPLRTAQDVLQYLQRHFDTLFEMLAAPLQSARLSLRSSRRGGFEAVVRYEGERRPTSGRHFIVVGRADMRSGPAVVRNVDDTRDQNALAMDLLAATLVFTICIGATMLLVLASASLLGLAAWEGTAIALPWIIGLAILAATAYGWADRETALGRTTFVLGVAAVSLFAVLRGVDVWVQGINQTNSALGLEGVDGLTPLAPRMLHDLRAFLPVPVLITAEIALVLGAALAHRGFGGIVCALVLLPALIGEATLFLVQMAVNLAKWSLGLLLGSTSRLLDIFAALPDALLFWLIARRVLDGAPMPGQVLARFGEQTEPPRRFTIAPKSGLAVEQLAPVRVGRIRHAAKAGD
ncbi:MAG: hypothetical protein EPO16_11485 [Dehalococcoidia bacterium]|nr:MAG: hypothetical protein EPO16_11485 [Dehalococcoidia bacterium]